MRPECNPPTARLVNRHDLGANAHTVKLSLEYGGVDELAGHARPGYVAVVNDHDRAYHAQRISGASQPCVGVWHPTIPNVALIMTSLDFGLSCAPYFFSVFTAMVQWNIVWWLGEDGFSLYYLDDNGIICRVGRAQPLLCMLDTMSKRCGWGYKLAKRQVGPLARCLGLRFDIESNTLMIVLSKLHRTLVLLGNVVGLIDAARADPTCTADVMEHRFLDMLTGTLGWLATCSYAGLLHMGPFYYAVRVAAFKRLPRLSRISGLYEACQWWLNRAASGRLRGHRRLPCISIPSLSIAFDPSYRALPTMAQRAIGSAVTDADNVATLVTARRADGGRVVCLQNDAGAEAWGITIDSVAYWGRFRPDQMNWSSGAREFNGTNEVVTRFPQIFRDAFVVLGFDNASDVLEVSLGRARGTRERQPLAGIFEGLDEANADLAVWWCTRRINAGPEELSKCTTASDARRWSFKRGLQLVICEGDGGDELGVDAAVDGVRQPDGGASRHS